MRVERFFLFFPPKLVSIKRGETEYGIGMIPLGGFVKITGMNPEELEADEAETAEGRDTPEGLLERVESAGQDPSEREQALPRGAEARLLQPAGLEADRGDRGGPGDEHPDRLPRSSSFSPSASSARRALEVGTVEHGTPAAGALQPGDQIVSVDGAHPPNGGSQPSTGDLTDRADAIAKQVNNHSAREVRRTTATPRRRRPSSSSATGSS